MSKIMHTLLQTISFMDMLTVCRTTVEQISKIKIRRTVLVFVKDQLVIKIEY